ncbi:MAG: hypothetical protein ACTSRP_00920 [Candidatus Helarchaeota archaeon]
MNDQIKVAINEIMKNIGKLNEIIYELYGKNEYLYNNILKLLEKIKIELNLVLGLVYGQLDIDFTKNESFEHIIGKNLLLRYLEPEEFYPEIKILDYIVDIMIRKNDQWILLEYEKIPNNCLNKIDKISKVAQEIKNGILPKSPHNYIQKILTEFSNQITDGVKPHLIFGFKKNIPNSIEILKKDTNIIGREIDDFYKINDLISIIKERYTENTEIEIYLIPIPESNNLNLWALNSNNTYLKEIKKVL